MPYYAVAKGHNIGIYNFWNDVKEQVLGFKNAKYRKFDTKEDAEKFISDYNTRDIEQFTVYEKFDDAEVNYFVYTDGSCVNNGKPNSIAGIGIYFVDNDERNMSKLFKSTDEYKHTNNSAELIAIIECYNLIKTDLFNGIKICIVTDSDYSLKCATSYGEKCSSIGWTKDIPNKIYVQQIYAINKNNDNLKFKHIKAHTNNTDIHSIGNKNADKLAYDIIQKI
jgi:ribonuclease HI